MAEGDNASGGGGDTAGVDRTKEAGVGGVATGCTKSEAESDKESGVGIKKFGNQCDCSPSQPTGCIGTTSVI